MGFLYWYAFRPVSEETIIEVNPFLPKVQVDYSKMRWPLTLCFIASGSALFFGIVHVAIMRPYSAFAYIIIAGGGSGIILH